MGLITGIKTLKPKIKILLEKYPHLRDDDNKLIANIWHNEKPKDCDSAQEFLHLLASGGLTSTETIRRTRQKIQEQNPSLRGQKYKSRNKLEKEVRKEINNL